MPGTDAFLVFTRKLRDLQLPHMVTGSVAATFYGEPRMTYDVDIVVDLKPEDATRFEAAFPNREFYCPPREAILSELARPERGHFNLIHQGTGFKADIYLSGVDPFHAWALSRVRRVDYEGETLVLAPPEYVIVRKLQFYREGGSPKHLRDIHRMLIGLGETWDRSPLLELIAQCGLQSEWTRAQKPEAT